MALAKDLKEFIELLNSREVEYVITGAYALAYHGIPRYTGDVDLFIRPSRENAGRMARVIEEFGFGTLGLTAADFAESERVIQLGVAPNRIDVLTTLTGVTFEEVWESRVQGELDGIPVAFIGREEFIRNKRALGRPQDLADVAALE
jgi:hypothetical protein